MPDRFDHRAPIALDLEATCWGTDQPALRAQQLAISEIIEIGAVRLDPSSLAVTDSFRCFVRPEYRPILSGFCTELTSITQADVDGAPPLDEAAARLERWLGDAPPLLFAWGGFERDIFQRVYAQLGRPSPFDGAYGDLRKEFMDWGRSQGMGRLRVGVKRALEILEIPLEGTQHRALDDARLAAKLLAALRDPARMSPESRRVLALALERHPSSTHRGHARAAGRARGWEMPGGPNAWWQRASQELIRLGFARLRIGGGGLALTARGLAGSVDGAAEA